MRFTLPATVLMVLKTDNKQANITSRDSPAVWTCGQCLQVGRRCPRHCTGLRWTILVGL